MMIHKNTLSMIILKFVKKIIMNEESMGYLNIRNSVKEKFQDCLKNKMIIIAIIYYI